MPAMTRRTRYEPANHRERGTLGMDNKRKGSAVDAQFTKILVHLISTCVPATHNAISVHIPTS
jgi:hypothetical protein